ncbi:MAG: lysophospholipid acyltransferase family protein [Sandaracinaceae bacterium]
MHLRDLSRAAATYAWTGAACANAIGGHWMGGDKRDLDRRTVRWARVLQQMWGLELEVRGLEHYQRDATTVLVANHQSYVDVVALFLALPEMPVFLAKRELARVPLFGRVMETRGDVFIDRQHREAATSTIDRTARILRPGEPVLVFPEGTRARAPVISAFKKGAFHLARQAHAAIQPIGIRGSLEAWPRDRAAPVGGHVRVTLGPRVDADTVQRSELDTLVAEIRSEVARLAELPLAERAQHAAA